MEVHHHAHSEHAKKSWRTYIWEFVMLFLAVFCGFLAEYQLEHTIEKDRVSKYMHDMTENLKYDTVRISKNRQKNYDCISLLDSFRNEVKEAIKGKINTNKLYSYSIKNYSNGLAVVNKAAITQLKNSGQLRLIKSDSLTSKILDYYDRLSYINDTYSETVRQTRDALEEQINKVFRSSVFEFAFDTLMRQNTTTRLDNLDFIQNESVVVNSGSLKLLRSDNESLEFLHTALLKYQAVLADYIYWVQLRNKAAIDLVIDIERVYKK